MKISLAFLTSLLVSISLTAQISITSSDMPTAGFNAFLSVPDSLVLVDLDQTGANSSWDYSSLDAVVQRKDSFVSLGDVPFTFFLFFGGATAIRLINTPDSLMGFSFGSGFEFFRTTSSAFEAMGFGGDVNGLPVPLANDPRDRVFPLPLNYQDTDSSFSSAELAIPGLVYLKQEQNRQTQVDGWGSITTPYGTFDALRVVATLNGFDSIALGDTLNIALPRPQQKEYKWLANGEKAPILQVNTTLLDTVEIQSTVWYLDERREVPILAEDDPLDSQPLLLSPNPSAGQVRIDWERQWGEVPTLEVFTLDGRLMHQQPMPDQIQQLDFRHLPAATYVVVVRTEDRLFQGKLVLH